LYLKSGLGLLHGVFWSFMIFNCDDCMRTTVLIPLHEAISNLLCQFYTTMCLVMTNIVSLYISVFLCLCLPDWRINVFNIIEECANRDWSSTKEQPSVRLARVCVCSCVARDETKQTRQSQRDAVHCSVLSLAGPLITS